MTHPGEVTRNAGPQPEKKTSHYFKINEVKVFPGGKCLLGSIPIDGRKGGDMGISYSGDVDGLKFEIHPDAPADGLFFHARDEGVGKGADYQTKVFARNQNTIDDFLNQYGLEQKNRN